MRKPNRWKGPFHPSCYLLPSASGQEVMTVNMISRFMPFRDFDENTTIMARGARNLSGQTLGAIHAGVETADEKARRENFAFSA